MTDFKIDYGAKGDTQDLTSTVTIGAGGFAANRLHFTTLTPFVVGDVGKAISVGGAGATGSVLSNYSPPITITAFVNSSTVDLSVSASTFLTASSQRVVWGTDDSNAFQMFNTANAGLSNVLTTMPAGTFTMTSIFQFCLGQGVKQYEIRGAGSGVTKLTNAAILPASIFLGAFWGVRNDRVATDAANVSTVSKRSRSVTLSNAADASIFNVNDWAVLAGLDGFGLWHGGGTGYPPNNYFYDYVKITAIHTGTTGPTGGDPSIVTFDRPVRYDYKSTWPLFDIGPPYEGGPAVLYRMKSEWDADATFTGFSLESLGAATNAIFRRVTYNDIKFLSPSACYPTQALEINAFNCDWTGAGTLELDKQVVNFNATDCAFHDTFTQSSSPECFTLDKCTFVSGCQTPRKLVARKSTFGSLGFGCVAAGNTQMVALTDCTVDSIANIAANVTTAGMSMANGIITVPNTANTAANVIGWAVPGGYFTFVGNLPSNRIYQILDITQDGTNCYITTTAPGGFPNGTGQNITRVQTHPCLSVTFDNVTSSNLKTLDICTAVRGAPLFTHVKRTYSSTAAESGANGAALTPFEIWGKLVTFTVNVTKRYTGSRGSLFFTMGNNSFNSVLDGSDNIYNYLAQFDLKTLGLRTITDTSATLLGADGGPAWPVGGWWGGGNAGPGLTQDISLEDPSLWPAFTIEITTDQGITQPKVLPLF